MQPVREPGEFASLDRAAADRHRQQAGRFRVREDPRVARRAGYGPLLKQHLIDPEICIRCNTCEATCPIGAITHDDNNYVVDAAMCNFCMDCIAPCPTGSIDNWCMVAEPYSLDEQFSLDRAAAALRPRRRASVDALDDEAAALLAEAHARAGGRARAPATASKPRDQSVQPRRPGDGHRDRQFPHHGGRTPNRDVRHIILDFGAMPFPVLEGQSDRRHAAGRGCVGQAACDAALFRRLGARRRAAEHQQSRADRQARAEIRDGADFRGVASNYLCDLKIGDDARRDRAVRRDVPDAGRSRGRHRDDLHRHGRGTVPRLHRSAGAAAQRGTAAAADVLRRPHAAGAALFRPAAEGAGAASSTRSWSIRAKQAKRISVSTAA